MGVGVWCGRQPPQRLSLCILPSLSMAAASSSPSTHAYAANLSQPQPSMLVFSGGTAFNGVVEELKKVTTRVSHVLPVSDDGGSTAEIVRVLGGPAVGDIRSRCLRLSDENTSEALAVRRLLGHRLSLDPLQAKGEWHKIVEGEHILWNHVSRPYRETIRAFLVYFQNQILRRATENFCFGNGSIGNFFFAGARIFFQSLDAAIFLFSRVSQIPSDSMVLPVVCTNDRLTLGCELWNGTVIRGQNEISHPTSGAVEPITKVVSSMPLLPARIKRIFYMSSEGTNLLHEVFPVVNNTVLEQLSKVDCIVYAMGSLFTSICPSLVLHGVGEVISQRNCLKVLLLNGSHDRESMGMHASDFVTAISDALNRKHGDPQKCLNNPVYILEVNTAISFTYALATLMTLLVNYDPSAYVNVVLAPKGGHVPVDIQHLKVQAICDAIVVDSIADEKVGIIFDPRSLIQVLANLMYGLTSQSKSAGHFQGDQSKGIGITSP